MNIKVIPALAVALMTLPAHAALVAHWTFDTDFTATAGGSAFDLTAVNGATAGTATGQFGQAANFTRATSQYAFTTGNVIGNNGTTSAGRDFSYSGWFNYTGPDITTGDRHFILETSSADALGGTGFFASAGLRDNNGTAGNGTVNGPDDLEIFSHSVGVGVTAHPTVGTITGWNNIVVTFQSTGATTGIFNTYLNGTLFNTNVSYTQSNGLVEALVIGGHRSGTGRNFQGQIDDVAFWDNVLTQSDVTYLQTHAVPEPTAALLGGLGLLALLRRRR